MLDCACQLHMLRVCALCPDEPCVPLVLQLLKQRVSQLENTAQQSDMVRQENSLLRQQLLELEAAVRGRAVQLGVAACRRCCLWDKRLS